MYIGSYSYIGRYICADVEVAAITDTETAIIDAEVEISVVHLFIVSAA